MNGVYRVGRDEFHDVFREKFVYSGRSLVFLKSTHELDDLRSR